MEERGDRRQKTVNVTHAVILFINYPDHENKALNTYLDGLTINEMAYRCNIVWQFPIIVYCAGEAFHYQTALWFLGHYHVRLFECTDFCNKLLGIFLRPCRICT